MVVGNPKKNPDPTAPSNLDSAAQKAYLEGFEEFDAGSLLILNGKIYTQNSGDPAISPYFAKMLNVYADSLHGKARVFSVVAPLSSAYIPLPNYERYAIRNKETLQAIQTNLNPKVYFADVMGEMNQHYNEYLWYGSDHHWTGLGAYYGYVAFCKAAGITPVPLNSMERRSARGFGNSLRTHARSIRSGKSRSRGNLHPTWN